MLLAFNHAERAIKDGWEVAVEANKTAATVTFHRPENDDKRFVVTYSDHHILSAYWMDWDAGVQQITFGGYDRQRIVETILDITSRKAKPETLAYAIGERM